MKNLFTSLIFLFAFTFSFAQINEQDSTVNVKTFWNNGDSKNYKFTSLETKNVGNNPTQIEELSYQIKINIVDVFEDELTVQWVYDSIKFDNKKFINNPLYLINQLPIKFVIDKDGRFLRYENLSGTIESFILSSEKIQNNFIDDVEILQKIKDLTKNYATEQNIVKIFEKDIRQFHLFYGTGDYKLNETVVENNSYMDNLFSPSPTPAKTKFMLKDIAFTGTNYIVNAYQQADKEWLSNSWYNYLKKLAEELGSEQPDESRINDEITYTVNTNSRIKDNGWVSYSIETKKVVFQDTDYTLVRKIEIQ